MLPTVMVGVYLVLFVLYPYPLFSKKLQVENFEIYYNIDSLQVSQAHAIVDTVKQKLKKCPYYSDADKERVFMVNNKLLYKMLCPVSASAFATNATLFNNIFVANAGLKQNKAHKYYTKIYQGRSLVNLLAHEVCHSLISRQQGFLQNLLNSAWIEEGYCECIAYGTQWEGDRSFQMLDSLRGNENVQAQYKSYHLCAQYLLEVQELSVDDLLKMDKPLEEVRSQIL